MAKLNLHRVTIGQLQEIDLTISPGEIVCLSGPSGCGKTRLLRAIADLEPHSGHVQLGKIRQGEVPGHRWRAAVMLVPAESAWWHDTVGAHLVGNNTSALEQLGFDDDVCQWPIARLSSGEKHRLALVRALSRRPAALLLDEPTANLDRENTAKVETWLRTIIREQQLPTLWVAHHEDQIQRVADRHFVIVDKHIEAREVSR
ncbi:ATP-binding cassette domain-containing protein [Microbulbifer bruguierae]|uniref:ATP-binding cassette domain-containing protein n=1 Tax=Microbulbifer bruguierae TaxID=3029061 RepID=A0ABY8NIB3_9GAMM|nr:ATP-binding cassette domain-containing protein [Microbulbifer bruguierae]WGL18327.1 ATP-binding cassette domain-containing protein [Microbulbifer bruguierae]